MVLAKPQFASLLNFKAEKIHSTVLFMDPAKVFGISETEELRLPADITSVRDVVLASIPGLPKELVSTLDAFGVHDVSNLEYFMKNPQKWELFEFSDYSIDEFLDLVISNISSNHHELVPVKNAAFLSVVRYEKTIGLSLFLPPFLFCWESDIQNQVYIMETLIKLENTISSKYIFCVSNIPKVDKVFPNELLNAYPIFGDPEVVRMEALANGFICPDLGGVNSDVHEVVLMLFNQLCSMFGSSSSV